MELNMTIMDNFSNESNANDWQDTPGKLSLDFRRVVNEMDYYWVPIIFIVGICGNLTSFVVFVGTPLRNMSWSVYLAALAVSDSGFLFCLFVSWGNNVGIHWYHKNGWCQFFVYSTYFWSFLSVWYVVTFTVERFIVVCFPLRRTDVCTVRRARIAVIVLAAVAGIIYTFALWTSEVKPLYGRQEFCSPIFKYYNMLNIIGYLDTVITLILPFLVITILNMLIVYRVSHYHSRRHTLLASEQSHTDSEKRTGSLKVKGKISLQKNSSVKSLTESGRHSNSVVRMTKMLVVVSSAFLLLNLPAHSIRTYSFFMSVCYNQYQPAHWLISLQKLFQYVYYANFAINFILYSVCGNNFRIALKGLFQHFKFQLCEKCPCVNTKLDRSSISIPRKTAFQRSCQSNISCRSVAESRFI